MGRSDEDLAHEIFLAHRHAGAAAAAAALRAIGRQRHALDVAVVADRHDHVLALDQGLDVGLELEILDDGAARVGELFLDRAELLAQHLEEPRARAQDLEMRRDLGDEAGELLGDLVALEPGEALQAQFEDRLGLLVGEAIGGIEREARAPRRAR